MSDFRDSAPDRARFGNRSLTPEKREFPRDVPNHRFNGAKDTAQRATDHWIVTAGQGSSNIGLKPEAETSLGMREANLKCDTFIDMRPVEHSNEHFALPQRLAVALENASLGDILRNAVRKQFGE